MTPTARRFARGVAALAIALTLGAVPLQGRAGDPAPLTGEWVLAGKLDGEPLQTTLLVHADALPALAVTRRTLETVSGRVTTYAGRGERKGDRLELDLVRLGDRVPLKAAYTIDGTTLEARLEGATALGWSKAQEKGPRLETDLVRGPYLQNASAGAVTIVWATAAASTGQVEWGETPSLGKTSGAPSESATRHAVVLDGLEAKKKYFYRVVREGRPLSSIEPLRTAASPGEPFTALVFGDTGTGDRAQLELARRVATEGSNLVLHTGDVIYGGTSEAGYDTKFFAPYGDMLRTRCLFPVVGNHDTDPFAPYERAFVVPANNPEKSPRYYSFEWGDAKIICLDTSGLSFQPGPQAVWLRSELASRSRRFTIVVTHVPPVTSKSKEDESAAVERGLLPILEEAEVDLLLCGHKHRYERTHPLKRTDKARNPAWPGIVHVVTGGGGADLSKVKTPPHVAFAESVHHYVLLAVAPTGIKARAVRLDGTTLDEFEIKKS